jgi:hypothetical protein
LPLLKFQPSYILLPGDDLFQRKHVVTRLYGYNKYLFVIKVLYSITLDGHNEMNVVKTISLPHILHTNSGTDSAHHIREITFVRILEQTSMGTIITFTDWSFF